MQDLKVEDVLDGLAELVDMLVQDQLDKTAIKEFKRHLANGLSIKEAQSKIVFCCSL